MRTTTLFLFLCSLAQAGEFHLTDGMEWSNPNGKPLVADLYLPEGKGPFPVAVYLHGGGWTSGDRKQLRRQAAHMASLGVAGFAVEYRLAPANKFPAAYDDALEAVRWVRAHAAEYRFDPARIAAVGSSAGGHLAALLGTSAPADAKVSAVVAFNPVLDVFEARNGESGNVKFFGGTCVEKAELCKAGSPLANVKPGLPPFLILHGTADENVPYHQATKMTEALRQAGDSVELFTAPGGKHTFWSTPEWYEKSEKAMEVFLMKVFSK